jgi:hypothetical protein
VASTEPKLHHVKLWLCEPCLNGAGGECHTPGCALWMNRAPDLSVALSGQMDRAPDGHWCNCLDSAELPVHVHLNCGYDGFHVHRPLEATP